MREMNAGLKILMENAKTFSQRNEIMGLMESEMQAVNNSMISNLYKSAIEKAHVDFEDIPESKGDITRYSGYQSMVQSLDIIDEIATKHGVKVPEVETVRDAIKNVALYREQFERGFRMEKEFIVLQYNALVYACVESTSVLISSYVDFVKRPDRVEFSIIRNAKHGGHASVQNLARFNHAVKQGDFTKVMNTVLNSGKEGFVGLDSMVVPALIIGGVLVLVPLVREIIFGYYYSRMRISDYLAQQAMLLEINKQNIQASTMSAKEKNAIIKKQADKITKLRRMSDAIKVDRTMADSKASIEMNKENKNWTIEDVKSQSASTDSGGFQLL
jgi:hypothetical protein